MDKSKVFWEDLGVTAEISAFTPQDKIEEFHVMLHVEPRAELFDGQLKRIYEGEERLLRLPQVMGADVILKRYFLSDSTNQQPLMKQGSGLFRIRHPATTARRASKVAVWLYLQKRQQGSQRERCHRGGTQRLPSFMEDGHARTQRRLGLANGISAHQLRGNLTKLQRHAGRQLYPYVVFRTRCRHTVRRHGEST